jgi:putative redox protein
MRFDFRGSMSARNYQMSSDNPLPRSSHAGDASWRMALNSPGVSIVAATVLNESRDPLLLQRIVCGTHGFLSDQPRKSGGGDVAPSPFGYLISALGACTSMSLRAYADAKEWRLGTIKVVLELRRHAGTNYIERSVALSRAISRLQRVELARVCESTPVTLAVKHGITIHTRLAAPSASQSDT